MADTKQQKRDTLRDLVYAIFTKELTDEQLDALLNGLEGIEQVKEPTRTKSFRLPTDLLDWLEEQAEANRRSPNGQLIEILQNAKAHA